MHYCKCNRLQDAIAFIQHKAESGWNVMVQPFVTKQDMLDLGHDMTMPIPTEWTFIIFKL